MKNPVVFTSPKTRQTDFGSAETSHIYMEGTQTLNSLFYYSNLFYQLLLHYCVLTRLQGGEVTKPCHVYWTNNTVAGRHQGLELKAPVLNSGVKNGCTLLSKKLSKSNRNINASKTAPIDKQERCN